MSVKETNKLVDKIEFDLRYLKAAIDRNNDEWELIRLIASSIGAEAKQIEMIAYKKVKEDQYASRSSSNSTYADVGAF